MTRHPDGATVLNAIIVDAGFAGLGLAVALRKQNITDFVVLEKTADVGGVWRDNSYPGVLGTALTPRCP